MKQIGIIINKVYVQETKELFFHIFSPTLQVVQVPLREKFVKHQEQATSHTYLLHTRSLRNCKYGMS